MNKQDFKEKLQKQINEVKKALQTFDKVYDYISIYDGKKIGDKTKEKINAYLKQQFSCCCYILNDDITIIPLGKDGYSYCVTYKFYNKHNVKNFIYSEKSNGFVLSLDFKANYFLGNALTNMINVDLDKYIDELEQNYNEAVKTQEQLKQKMNNLSGGLYSSFYYRNQLPYCFEELLNDIIQQNRLN